MSTRKRFSWTSPLMRILLALGLLLAATAAQAIERVTYYHNDALGSPVAATDGNGTLVWRENYAPYGERLTKEASGKDTVWYTGKQEEAAFGLNYFGARWYDPKIGRFMGVDPAGFSAGNIQSFNRYAYANNNPYLYVDPDGKFPLILFAPVIAEGFGAALAGGINAAQQYYETGHVQWSGVGGVFDAAGDGALLGLAGWSASGLAAQGTAAGAEGGLGSVTKGTSNTPDFVVSPNGTAFPVPKGAQGPMPVTNPAGKQTGTAYTGGAGGANGQVDTIRIMNTTKPRGSSPGYPNGYVKYENAAGQGVSPNTGRTLPNNQSHFPIE